MGAIFGEGHAITSPTPLAAWSRGISNLIFKLPKLGENLFGVFKLMKSGSSLQGAVSSSLGWQWYGLVRL